ncbi:MAG: hypothetical protein FD164_2090 [Nitrospirae bacterium]|nr:MAG: hypothetical protein FD164_2090 [Nitrospirota bacterium]
MPRIHSDEHRFTFVAFQLDVVCADNLHPVYVNNLFVKNIAGCQQVCLFQFIRRKFSLIEKRGYDALAEQVDLLPVDYLELFSLLQDYGRYLRQRIAFDDKSVAHPSDDFALRVKNRFFQDFTEKEFAKQRHAGPPKTVCRHSYSRNIVV